MTNVVPIERPAVSVDKTPDRVGVLLVNLGTPDTAEYAFDHAT